jgi:hypothetical protein
VLAAGKGKGSKAEKEMSKGKASAGPHAGAPSAAAMEALVLSLYPTMEGACWAAPRLARLAPRGAHAHP